MPIERECKECGAILKGEDIKEANKKLTEHVKKNPGHTDFKNLKE